MKIKELIEKLQKCDPEAQAYTEQYRSNEVAEIAMATNNLGSCVYIGDDLEELAYAYQDEFGKDECVFKKIN